MTQDEIDELTIKESMAILKLIHEFADLEVAKEREACAKVCDEVAEYLRMHKDFSGAQIAASLAFDIRDKGEK
jgi:hypothetical protein